MLEEAIFTQWQNQDSLIWGQVPQSLKHRLHDHALFTNDAIAQLIDHYPRQHYSLVQWGQHGQSGSFREGDLGGLTGYQVLQAIQNGKIWINLRNVPLVNKAYEALMQDILAELTQHLPSLNPYNPKMGILVSSPGSRTLYHCDLPGQSLWQIRGVKRLYLYPATAPFMTQEHIERVALSGVEVNMPYQPWYDDYAQIYDLEPGSMMHWPLNAPHRVDNGDCLNISMTLEWFTPEIRRHHMITVANAILRLKFGLQPKERSIYGLNFWSKAVLQKALRDLPFIKKENKAKRKAEFCLDPNKLGALIELPKA